jgi:hypothetical protein
MKATSIAFERLYSDVSGVEFAVRYEAHPVAEVAFECIDSVRFPAEEIDWLIQCLQRIKAEHDAGAK